MKLVGVIDVQAGRAVHALAGRRADYRPVRTVLAKTTSDAEPEELADPVALAQAYHGFELTTLYVADLDAIAGAPPNIELYRQIAAVTYRLWIDAGIRSTSDARSLVAAFPDTNVDWIVGSETLGSKHSGNASAGKLLAGLLELLSPDRLIFSIDLRGGRVISPEIEWQDLAPSQLAGKVIGLGVRRLILLDLEAVGAGQGTPTVALCRELRAQHPNVELITGGGIIAASDLAALDEAGCDAAIVASALHRGTITRAEITPYL